MWVEVWVSRVQPGHHVLGWRHATDTDEGHPASMGNRNGGPVMDQTLFTLPILPGKTAAARAFLQELGGPRKADLAACGQSAGIAREVWAIQQAPQGDCFVAYMAGDDL